MRLSWELYFLEIANLVAERSTCLRRQVGAIAVKDRRIIATGYNGQIKNAPHCKVCLREELGIPSGEREEICRAIHAEQNVIIQCAIYGVSIKGSTLYCTTKPCITCFKMLVNAEIPHILYLKPYHSTSYFKSLLKECCYEEIGYKIDGKQIYELKKVES